MRQRDRTRMHIWAIYYRRGGSGSGGGGSGGGTDLKPLRVNFANDTAGYMVVSRHVSVCPYDHVIIQHTTKATTTKNHDLQARTQARCRHAKSGCSSMRAHNRKSANKKSRDIHSRWLLGTSVCMCVCPRACLRVMMTSCVRTRACVCCVSVQLSPKSPPPPPPSSQCVNDM